MSKRKLSCVDNLHFQLRKIHCREPSILYRLWFLPDVNQIFLKYLEMKDIVRSIQCDSNLYQHGPRELKEITTTPQSIGYLSRTPWIFTNVSSIHIRSSLKGKHVKEIFVTSMQYPLLRKLFVENISIQRLIITCPIQDLRVEQEWEDVEIVVPATLQKLSCTSSTRLAQQLLSHQSQLEEVTLMIDASIFGDDVISSLYNCPRLRKLSCGGFFSVCIISFENLEELCLYGTKLFLAYPCQKSKMKFMEISNDQNLTDLLLTTEFPHLNFFAVKDMDFDPIAHKLFNECITKDQETLYTYKTSQKTLHLSQYRYVYCNNVIGFQMVEAPRIEQNYFYLCNTPDLKTLKGLHDNVCLLYFKPNASLDSVEFSTSSIQSLYNILKETTPHSKLQLTLSSGAVEQLSSLSLQSVTNLELRVSSQKNSIDVVLDRAQCLESLKIITPESVPILRIRFLHILSPRTIRVRVYIGKILIGLHLQLQVGEEQEYSLENSFPPSSSKFLMPEIFYNTSTLEFLCGSWSRLDF